MKRGESFQGLHFIVANDPAHDFDLVEEAWIGDWMVAIIYRIGWGSAEEWHVSFFPQQKESHECALSWVISQKITQTFAAFQEEMDQIPKELPD